MFSYFSSLLLSAACRPAFRKIPCLGVSVCPCSSLRVVLLLLLQRLSMRHIPSFTRHTGTTFFFHELRRLLYYRTA